MDEIGARGGGRGGAAAVGGPLLLIGAVVGGIVGAKVLRRRTAPRVSARFVGGWRELVDQARDFGQPIPVGTVTRREQAGSLDTASAPALARTLDPRTFRGA